MSEEKILSQFASGPGDLLFTEPRHTPAAQLKTLEKDPEKAAPKSAPTDATTQPKKKQSVSSSSLSQGSVKGIQGDEGLPPKKVLAKPDASPERAGGFSFRVASIKDSSKKGHVGQNTDSPDEEGSFGSNEQENNEESPKRTRVESSEQGRTRPSPRNTSMEQKKNTPTHNPHKRQGQGAMSVNLSEAEGLAIRPRGIIKPAKFQTVVNKPDEELQMTGIQQGNALPLSLFSEDDNNKYLAVRNWENEMRQLSEKAFSPKSARSKDAGQGFKNVTFSIPNDDEEAIKKREIKTSKQALQAEKDSNQPSKFHPNKDDEASPFT